ncbi:MAG: hypothetical protein GQ574_02580 [Crocinitomix sp.]|nr:hypothetical protein [Crocinitomix sp.]
MRWQFLTLFNFFTFFGFGQSSTLEVFKDTTGLLGYKSGEEIKVAPIFQDAHEFRNGYAKVRLDDQYGIIDTTGTWYIEANNERISPVVNGHYITYKDSIFSIFELDGTSIFSGRLLDFNLTAYTTFLQGIDTYADAGLVMRIIESHVVDACRIGHSDIPLLASKSILENYETTLWFLNQLKH